MAFGAEDVFDNFSEPTKCRELIRMFLNGGLLPEILQECAEFVKDTDRLLVFASDQDDFYESLLKYVATLSDSARKEFFEKLSNS